MMEEDVIVLKNVWRVKLTGIETLVDPCDFIEMANWGLLDASRLELAIRVKGYKALVMLGRTILINKKETTNE